MTGFGKSILINEQREYQIEMKSVNHRYLDINVRIPRQIMYLEETIKKVIFSTSGIFAISVISISGDIPVSFAISCN